MCVLSLDEGGNVYYFTFVLVQTTKGDVEVFVDETVAPTIGLEDAGH